MWLLVEIAAGMLLATATVKVIIALTARRAGKRQEAFAASGRSEIPGRLTWPERTGRRGSQYGKITLTGNSMSFRTVRGKVIDLPTDCTSSVEPSWRSGNATIEFLTPDGHGFKILVSEKDSEVVMLHLENTQEEG